MLRTKLNTLALLSFFSIILAVSIMYVGFLSFTKVEQSYSSVENIQQHLQELNSLTFDYLQSVQNTRIKEQWYSNYNILLEKISNGYFIDVQKQHHLSQRLQKVKREFLILDVKMVECSNIQSTNQQTCKKILKRINTQLLISIENMFDLVEVIEEDTFNHSKDRLHKYSIIILSIILIMSTIVIGLTLYILRYITTRIENLDKATHIIKNGNFEHKIEIPKDDELGSLAKSFNEMAVKINIHQNYLEELVNERTKELNSEKNLLQNALSDLTEAQSRLVQTEKMAFLGSMVAGVAHEINTPLGISLTGATSINDDTKEIYKLHKNGQLTEESFEKYLENIQNISKSMEVSLARGASLVRTFKSVAVDQTSEQERLINLNEYIQEILLSMRNQLKRLKLSIHTDISSNINLLTYPGMLSQIIMNLINNAILHAFDSDIKGTIKITATKQDEYVFIVFNDNGSGISKKDINHIFEPFFTTKRNDGGTGLGMHIVHNLVVKGLDGTIDVQSEPNIGTSVTFSIHDRSY